MTGFFSDNVALITRYQSDIESQSWGEAAATRLAVLRPLLNNVIANPATYDTCTVFIQAVGDQFLALLREQQTEDSITRLTLFCARIAYERVLRAGGRISQACGSLINWFTPMNPAINRDEWHEFSIAWPTIQRDVASEAVTARGSELGQTTLAVREQIDRFEKLLGSTEQTIASAEERLTAYEASAKRIETAFNFAGLHEAFRGLAEVKRTEADAARRRARNRGIWSVLPFLVPVVIALISLGDIQPNTKTTDILRVIGERVVFSALVILPLVGVLLYFFRLAYAEHRSLSAVLLQLEHRQSMCTFIQNYAEFTGDKTKLEKFEALIFGGITPDPGAVPSTFDGIEQFAKVLEAVKK